jgi:hypothetical protein
MNRHDDDQRLDELIPRAIDSGRPAFDAEQWKRKYTREVDMLGSAGVQEYPVGRGNIWRTIMQNKRVRYVAAAAAVVLIVLGGTSFFSVFSNQENAAGQWWLGPPAAIAEEVQAALVKVKAVTCRERITWVLRDGQRSPSSTWNRFYLAEDRYRRDIYDGSRLREIHWYTPEGGNMIQTAVHFEQRSYNRRTHDGLYEKRDPIERMRLLVESFDEADRLLGTEVIEGQFCVGFEIQASKLNSAGGKEMVCRVWFDTDTRLPVRVEHEWPQTGDGSKAIERVILSEDEFDWNPALPADTFVVRIPTGFNESDGD